MNYSYIVINNKKIYIGYLEDKYIFLKEDKKELVKLTKDEEKPILEIINRNYGYNYESEKLYDIVYYNDGIEDKKFIAPLLIWMEKFIPKQYRDTFYKNLKTAKIELNLNFNKEEPLDESIKKRCRYDSRENIITLEKEELKKLWDCCKDAQNSNDLYLNLTKQTLLHELFHMASTNYDKKTRIINSGFDEFPTETISKCNRGLTEGFTDLLAYVGIPNQLEYSSGYYNEMMICRMLMEIIGQEVFFESYFNNKGTKLIEEELYKLKPDKNYIYYFIRGIESNFQFRNLPDKQSILASVQNSILEFLDLKLKRMTNQDEIKNIFLIFDNFLITPDKIEKCKKNPNFFANLENNIVKYNEIKNNYEDILNQKQIY